MPHKTLFLVCNAHLDPVWLWDWQEGLAETLSTFRTAARLCEEHGGFVFCHNEALLYQFIETYEPHLFEDISRLIHSDKWHIMGGWYLQPDCNIPSGESFVRQTLVGKRYFMDKFGVEPTVAVNFDPFGHTRGIVQILCKSGYKGYLFCRPGPQDYHLESNDFRWTGYDGSEILAHRAPDHYNSERGKAVQKIQTWIEKNSHLDTGILLWGIGNHGGGASREDLETIRKLQSTQQVWNIRHGTPEDYFGYLDKIRASLPIHETDLNPWAVGCYTSMALVKQKHRTLENSYFQTEKMATNAAIQGVISYPVDELRQALEDLLFCQFHDILPGSSISEVESSVLQRLDHGLEILDRLSARMFFNMLSGHEPAAEGEYPLFIYNPHPFDVIETVICEFQPPVPNFDRNVFFVPEVVDSEGKTIPSQLEKESCNIKVDQRKRVVFKAKLRAASMNRFSCRLKPQPSMSRSPVEEVSDEISISSETTRIAINRQTGLMDSFMVDGIEFLQPGAFAPLVMKDYPDPWGMKVNSFRDMEGKFTLMTSEESARFAGVPAAELTPVRVIEDGPVRTIVEALFKYRNSTLCMRYKIPKIDGALEIEIRVYWMEKDRMLKLSIPTAMRNGSCRGQVAYGVEEFDRHAEELVAQRWTAVVSKDRLNALTIINDTVHGFDFENGEIRLSLLRSPAYSGHPVGDDLTIVREDRFEPRIDQGERRFRFWINAGDAADRLNHIDREATMRVEHPLPLCCFPPGTGKKAVQGITLSDEVVQLGALKLSEDGSMIIIRLFEPSGSPRSTTVTIPAINVSIDVSLSGFEIKTIGVNLKSMEVIELDLLERLNG